MALTNDEKSDEELTCRFKTDSRNLINFDPSPRKLHFNGLLFAEPVDWFLYDSHQKRNEACLLVINMVYTNCLTRCHASFLF